MKHEEYAQMWKGFHERGRIGRKPAHSIKEICAELKVDVKLMTGKLKKTGAPKPACYVHSRGAMRPRYDRSSVVDWWKSLKEEENADNQQI